MIDYNIGHYLLLFIYISCTGSGLIALFLGAILVGEVYRDRFGPKTSQTFNRRKGDHHA